MVHLTRHSAVGQASAAGHQPLPKSVHASEAGSATVSEQVLNSITKSGTFESFSGLSKHIIPAAWTVALAYNKTKDVHMVGLVWQSSLAVTGDVVQHIKALSESLCVSVGECGCEFTFCFVACLLRYFIATINVCLLIDLMLAL